MLWPRIFEPIVVENFLSSHSVFRGFVEQAEKEMQSRLLQLHARVVNTIVADALLELGERGRLEWQLSK